MMTVLNPVQMQETHCACTTRSRAEFAKEILHHEQCSACQNFVNFVIEAYAECDIATGPVPMYRLHVVLPVDVRATWALCTRSYANTKAQPLTLANPVSLLTKAPMNGGLQQSMFLLRRGRRFERASFLSLTSLMIECSYVC